ncbi:MAG TPA: hypothetical protein PKW35_00080 [Nannocystaceae bacterium]|nr:hypothetical protein [Nannocystaceae bacterium]
MQLIEHQEAQALAVADHLAIELVLPGHQQLEHHEVGQQDVGRVVGDASALLAVLLTRVTLERDGLVALDVRYELVEFLELAVCQRVHRVDDDRPCAARGALPLLGEHRAHDRDEEAERLARARACRDDVALALRGEDDGLLLVLVEGERRSVGAEDVGGARVEGAVRDERLEVQPALVARVDLKERVRPEAPLRVDRLDLRADVLREDRRERRSELPVLADDRVAQREDVHAFAAHEHPLLALGVFFEAGFSSTADQGSVISNCSMSARLPMRRYPREGASGRAGAGRTGAVWHLHRWRPEHRP